MGIQSPRGGRRGAGSGLTQGTHPARSASACLKAVAATSTACWHYGGVRASCSLTHKFDPGCHTLREDVHPYAAFASSKTSSHVTTRSRDGMAALQAVEQCGLARLGPTGHQNVQPADHGGPRNRAACRIRGTWALKSS